MPFLEEQKHTHTHTHTHKIVSTSWNEGLAEK